MAILSSIVTKGNWKGLKELRDSQRGVDLQRLMERVSALRLNCQKTGDKPVGGEQGDCEGAAGILVRGYGETIARKSINHERPESAYLTSQVGKQPHQCF